MKRRVECIEFNGIRFRRYPDSEHDSFRRYYRPGTRAAASGVQALHQEVWKARHGPIPAGHHIHHRDSNPSNNHIDNLECLTAAEHLRRHHSGQVTPRKLEHLEAIRPLTKAWHASEAGLAWHRQHGVEVWAGRTPVSRTCDRCSKTYETLKFSRTRFCSNACKSAARRASGVDDVEARCVVCGATFMRNRYSRTRCCSGGCAYRSRSLSD
jgi:hypothetical protein